MNDSVGVVFTQARVRCYAFGSLSSPESRQPTYLVDKVILTFQLPFNKQDVEIYQCHSIRFHRSHFTVTKSPRRENACRS
jgi:hypothetical protein